jgi:hypothetical protein
VIRRTHSADGTESTALYSRCEIYRYRLTRVWDDAGPHALFVMLNPSTASELRNDATVGRCEARARRSGFGAFSVCNLFALRATRPADLRRASEPVGHDNDRILLESALEAEVVICAWGVHGAFRDRGPTVAGRLADLGRPLWHLGLTKDGHPRHPLYLRNDALLEPWDDYDPTVSTVILKSSKSASGTPRRIARI